MADPNNDIDIVRSIRTGSHEAFGQLYDRYARLIYAVCYDATFDLNTAQDLCQEVFMRAHRKINTLEKPESVGAWLVSIAKNVGREHRRAAGRDRHQWHAEIDQVLPAHHENQSAPLAAVARLPEDERLAIHLFYLDEQPADLARSLLGLSRPGFYKVLKRARKHLRESLSMMEGTKS